MQNTVTQFLGQIAYERDAHNLRSVLYYLADKMSSQATASAGLVIKAGGGVLAKTGATAFAGVVEGVPVAIAAGTDMPALTGLTITANSFNVVVFTIDRASAVTARFGTEATTLAGVKFPDIPLRSAIVGYLVITHSSTFTGNTTPLDTATTVYVSPVGAFDPSIKLS